jgi:ankyrin repeat protein
VVVAAFQGHRAVAERVARAIGPDRLDPWEAALVGEAGALARHLAADPSLAAARRADGWPLLHLAGFYGHRDVVDLLVARGADVHARSANAVDNTALHAVLAMSGDAGVAERLLAAGADPNAAGGGGYTPLHIAASRGDVQGVALLRAHGADASARTADGRTAAAIAAERGHPDLAASLAAAAPAG